MIREACVNDSSRITEIHVFSWRFAYKEFISMDFLINEMTLKNRDEYFQKDLSEENKNIKTYVYEESNIIKGFMTIGECRDDDKNNETFELCGIYIDPLFQIQYIGTKFVKYCEEEALKKSKKEIILWVFEKNNESIKFYRKMGFEIDGRVKEMNKFNENAIRMHIKL